VRFWWLFLDSFRRNRTKRIIAHRNYHED